MATAKPIDPRLWEEFIGDSKFIERLKKKEKKEGLRKNFERWKKDKYPFRSATLVAQGGSIIKKYTIGGLVKNKKPNSAGLAKRGWGGSK